MYDAGAPNALNRLRTRETQRRPTMLDDVDEDALAARALPFASGALAAGAWFFVLDAALTHPDAQLDAVRLAPTLVASLALGAALLAPYKPLGNESSHFSSTSRLQCARLWLFAVMLLALASVYVAVGLRTVIVDLPAPALDAGHSRREYDARLGSAIVAHTVATGAATTLWVVRRVQVASSAF